MGKVKEMLDDQHSQFSFGYVYCLSNPAMPGLVKIGFTNRSAVLRAEELSFGTRDSSATGVPMPFEVVKDWQVPPDRSKEIEQLLHRSFHDHRVPPHGKWKAKEFFYMEPAQAVAAIEGELKKMDWWSVTQASKERFDAAFRDREVRQKSKSNLRKLIAEAKDQFQQSIEKKKNLLRDSATEKMSGKCQMHGFKWAAAWFFGSALLFDLLGAKDSALVFSAALAAIAFYISKDGPLTTYINSQEFFESLEKIETDGKAKESFGPFDTYCPSCATELAITNAKLFSTRSVACSSCKIEFFWQD